jgi:hypothetical protein
LEHNQLDLSVLHGDGTNTVAKKGGDGIGYSGYKHQKGEKVIAIIDNNGYVLAPLPVALVNEADTVLLPEGLKALKRMAKLTGLGFNGSYLNLDGGFQGEPSQSQNGQARAETVVQSSHPCLAGSRGADVCMGGQIQTVAAAL